MCVSVMGVSLSICHLTAEDGVCGGVSNPQPLAQICGGTVYVSTVEVQGTVHLVTGGVGDSAHRAAHVARAQRYPRGNR